MRAIAEEEFGGPIALMDLPAPEIGAGEVLIRVRAAGVNPFDWKVADGALEGEREHRFPLILGFDAAGVVEQVGAERYRACRRRRSVRLPVQTGDRRRSLRRVR